MNDEIKKLIFTLHEHKEYSAAKELAIAYLKRIEDIEILNVLAEIYFNNKEFQKSLDCVNEILNHHQDENILMNKARCLYYLKRAPEAEEIILSLSDELRNETNVQIDLALYKTAQGKFDESYDILHDLPRTDKVCFNYGWFLFHKNKFREGFEHLRHGAPLHVWGNEWITNKKYNISHEKRWDGEDVDTIAYCLEGGIGDEMIFIRYANHFKKYCKTIKIFCSEKILPFFEDCGFENLYPHEEIQNQSWDKYVPAMSAPYFLKLDDPSEGVSFPYLKKTANPVPEMNRIAKGKKKICIRWKGNPEFEHDQFRSVPVEKLLGLSKFGQLFSLQIEDSDLPKNADVWDLSHLINSWSDTYDIIAESDLVVTSCTSVTHLAAAMGKKVIVLPPIMPYITWASEDIKWYPDNVIVLRQMEYNDWDKTIEHLYTLVEKELSNEPTYRSDTKRMKRAILTYFNHEVDAEIAELQQRVNEKFNVGEWDYKPLFSQRPESEVTHHDSIDYGINHLFYNEGYDTVLVMDVDCIPLSTYAVDYTFRRAEEGVLIGNVQRSCHIDNGEHLFVSPSLICISKETYEKLDKVSFAPDHIKADAAEYLTWIAEERGIEVEMYMPLKYIRDPRKTTWDLGRGKEKYGIGTTFKNKNNREMFFHLFECRKHIWNIYFYDKCEEILDERDFADVDELQRNFNLVDTWKNENKLS